MPAIRTRRLRSQKHAPRWRRKPGDRPQQIVDAALEVFGRRGLAGARLEDIARQAGVAKGTIYLYFPNKKELFREVVRRTVVAAIEDGEHATRTGSPAEQLELVMQAYWRFVRSPAFATICRLVTGELHHFPDLARFCAEEVIARAMRLLAAVLDRGVREDAFRPVPPFVAARMLGSLCVMHSLWLSNELTHPAGLTEAQTFDQIRDFFLQALTTKAPSPQRPIK